MSDTADGGAPNPKDLLGLARAQAMVGDLGWRVIGEHLHAHFATEDFAQGAQFVAAIAHAADVANHHPDVDLRYSGVRVVLTSHDVGGLTSRDVDLAAAISFEAQRVGLVQRPERTQRTDVAIDALDIPAVLPFWRALLGYETVGADELRDPDGVGPGLWFQQMDAPRPQRSTFHLDVLVPHDVAQTRLEAAIAAGGTLLSDERSPAFWVLADAEGNEACICTWQARD
ncbi:MAG: VOC family protein [Cellulomonadaceae bacterium]